MKYFLEGGFWCEILRFNLIALNAWRCTQSSVLRFPIRAGQIKGRALSRSNTYSNINIHVIIVTVSFGSNQQYHRNANTGHNGYPQRRVGGYRKGKIGKFHSAQPCTEVTLINPEAAEIPGLVWVREGGGGEGGLWAPSRDLGCAGWRRPTSGPFTRTNGFRRLHASG
jgi:hypothetical protein